MGIFKVRKNNSYLLRAFILLLALIFYAGCGGDAGKGESTIDTTIPSDNLWDINTILEIDPATEVSPRMAFFQKDGRLHIAYYDENPEYDELKNNEYRYRVRYRAFNLNDLYYLNASNVVDETVTTLVTDGRSIGGLAVGVSSGTPIVAYVTYKELIHLDDADLNNQGDIMLGVRNDDGSWRNEIDAFGYVSPDRNPVFNDGLATADISLKGDENGNAQLCFQFGYEGIDSYNYDFPDLRFISQPINNIADNVNAVADLEETVEGNTYQNQSGLQYNQGEYCDLVIDPEGKQSVFYYVDYTENSSSDQRGLRVAQRVEGEWGAPVWIEKGIDVADISGAVMPDGRLAVAYAVKDGTDLINQDTIPYTLRYAEQHIVTTEVENDQGEIEEVVTYEWGKPEVVNYNTICGRYCSLALDSENNPVVAYFDEMNFTLNRFFSRIKISSRNSGGEWTVKIIIPEDVGLSNNTSPYEVTPGTHDSYYVGKYNYLWLNSSDKINLCTYSTITKKAYLFIEK